MHRDRPVDQTAQPRRNADDVQRPSPADPVSASVVDLTFAISLGAIVLLFSRAMLNGDGDPARHIVIGRHIWSHGPRFSDPFSFSRAGEPFLAYEWLSQAAYAGAHALAGLPGVALLAGLLIAASLALVVAWVRRAGGDPWLALVTGATAALLTYTHWLARPHLFSYVGLAALLHLTVRPRRELWIGTLFLLWANLHPGFLYGLIILTVLQSGAVVEDLRRGVKGMAALSAYLPVAAAGAASLVNPFGWTLHAHAIGWLGSTTVGYVDEFLPLELLTGYGVLYLAVVGLLITGFARQRRWVGWPVVLVFWAAFIAGLLARRNAPLFALFALPLTVRALTPVVRTVRWNWLRTMRAEFARSDRPGWAISRFVVIALLVLVAVDSRVTAVDVLPARFSPAVFPADAVATARELGLEGRLLSKYEWGGYLLYTWPGQRIFIDSMADFFGDELIGEYSTMARGAAGWQELMDKHGVSLVLMAPDMLLVAQLKQADDWNVIHEDDVAVLLARSDVTPQE